MPPALAMTLCILFVLLLLVVERRANPHPSGAAWIPTLWVLIAASKPLSTWFGTGVEDEGSGLDQVFGGALLVLGLVVLSAREFNWAKVMRAVFWLLVLLLYMGASAVWSDMPGTALKRWVRELIVVVMACVVASEESPKRTLESIFRRTAYILIPLSIVLIKYFPAYGVQYRAMGGLMWIGATLQKNGLGRLCLIATFFLVWSLVTTRRSKELPAIRRQRLADMAVLAIAFYLLVGPGDQYSATALTAISVGFSAYLYLLWRHRRGAKPRSLVTACVIPIVFAVGTTQPFMEGESISHIASGVGRDVTLTGRTEIWSGLMYVVSERPLLGTGVGSFWTNETKQLHRIGEAHNGYLDVILSLGFIGLLVTAFFLFASFKQALRTMEQDFDWGCLWFCFLLMVAVHNVTESSLNSLTAHLMSTIVFLALASVPRERNSGTSTAQLAAANFHYNDHLGRHDRA